MLFDLKFSNKALELLPLFAASTWVYVVGLIFWSLDPALVQRLLIPKFVKTLANKYPTYTGFIVLIIPVLVSLMILFSDQEIKKLAKEDPNKEYEIKA